MNKASSASTNALRGRAWAGAGPPQCAGHQGNGCCSPRRTDRSCGRSADFAGGRTLLRIPLQTGVARLGLSFTRVKCSEASIFSSLAQGISKQIKVMEDAGQGRAVFPAFRARQAARADLLPLSFN